MLGKSDIWSHRPSNPANYIEEGYLLLIDVHKVSKVSSRKLICPSLAWLASQPSQLGKFQLKLITTS